MTSLRGPSLCLPGQRRSGHTFQPVCGSQGDEIQEMCRFGALLSQKLTSYLPQSRGCRTETRDSGSEPSHPHSKQRDPVCVSPRAPPISRGWWSVAQAEGCPEGCVTAGARLGKHQSFIKGCRQTSILCPGRGRSPVSPAVQCLGGRPANSAASAHIHLLQDVT